MENTVIADEKHKLCAECNCHYGQNKDGCWILKKWDSSLFHDDGSPQIVMRVVADHYEINPAFPEDEFQITFPPGTVVSDARSNEGFLVKPDGSKRMIGGNEVFSRYEDISNTETGKAGANIEHATRGGLFAKYFWRVVWLIAAVSVLIALCGLFYVRQRRKRYGA